MISAPKLVRLACERHQRDREHGAERGLLWDEAAAVQAVAFFGMLRHWKGEWAGQPVSLEPWQQFIVASLMGWKLAADGTRRFRSAYLELPRKNGKTTMAAGLGLYMAFVDGEPGAEVYTAATKKDQARIAHKDAVKMVEASAWLKKEVKVFRDNLNSTSSNSKFEPLGSDSSTLDGLNVHMALADEVHAWPNRDLWDVLETGTGSRRQALMMAITTAGFDVQSLCWSHHDYTEKVLNGVIEDDSWFGMIFAIDEGDDWEDEAVWWKVNPNLGVSKKIDDMRRLANRAKEVPTALNSFLRLHLDMWTQAETLWINWNKWLACGELVVNEDELAGRKCYAGLDLSSTLDVTALVLVFPPRPEVEEPYQVVCRFWIPRENIAERAKRDRVPYDVWVREGLMTATAGDVVDYDFILAEVESLMETFEIKEIAFDRWGATDVAQKLQELGGDDWLVQFGQGYASMSPPMKDLEKKVMGLELAHGNNSVLNWMAANVVAREDPAGNVKPDKSKSREKIDGMVALIMALDRALRHEDKTSRYETYGIRTV